MKKTGIAVVACVMLFTFVANGQEKEDDAFISAPLKIGFEEAHNQPVNRTLVADFSKLKAKLESEFGATVTSHTGTWTFASLSNYDVFIVQSQWPEASQPTSSEISNLKNWVQNGGILIILWYPGFWEDPNVERWHIRFQDDLLDKVAGITIFNRPALSNNFTSFTGKFGTTPNNISQVLGDVRTLNINQLTKGAKVIARADTGEKSAAYNDSVGSGKIYVIGNLHAFLNAMFDLGDNADFLVNVLTDAIGGGGGGGGGGSSKLVIVRVKGKPKAVSFGDKLKCIGIVRNKGAATSTATKLEYYLSLNKTLDGADFKIGTVSVPAIPKNKKKRFTPKFNVPNIAADDYCVIGKLISNNAEKASKKTVEVQ